MALRNSTIDASRTTYLRAGIKWDPLERDTIEETYQIESDEVAEKRLRKIPGELKMLSTFGGVVGLLPGMAERMQGSRLYKLQEQKDLEIYLAQAKLASYDLDLCCYCYGGQKQIGFITPVLTEMNGVQKEDRAFTHTGDDVSGTGDAFDEELLINLNLINAAIDTVFVVIISNHHGFEQIKSGFWSIISTKNEQELMSQKLETKETHRLHVMAKMTREGTAWKIDELGQYLPLGIDEKIPLQQRVNKSLAPLLA